MAEDSGGCENNGSTGTTQGADATTNGITPWETITKEHITPTETKETMANGRGKRDKSTMKEMNTPDTMAEDTPAHTQHDSNGSTPPASKTKPNTPDIDKFSTPATKGTNNPDSGAVNLQHDINAEAADSDLDLYDESYYDDSKAEKHQTTANETADQLDTILDDLEKEINTDTDTTNTGNTGTSDTHKTAITTDTENTTITGNTETSDTNTTAIIQRTTANDESQNRSVRRVHIDTSQNTTQTYIVPPEIVHHKHEFRVLFTFVTTGQGLGTITQKPKKAEALHKALKDFIKAGQTVCSKLAINTWNPIHRINTIQKPSDTPTDYDILTKYMRCPPQSGIRRKGTNWYWGINVTCNIDMEHFCCYWDQQKPRSKQEKATSVFQTIKPAPLQAPDWYELGWLVGSGQHQNQQQNEKELAEMLDVPVVGLSWSNVSYDGSNKHWNQANQKFRKNKNLDEKFRMSPLAAQVLISEFSKTGQSMKTMYQTFGKVNESGAWPTFPDGSRMRYTPKSSHIKDIASRNSIQKRMSLHIQMKYSNQTIQTDVLDPSMMLDAFNGKTLQQIILSWTCPEEGYNQEPYFRHFSKRWSWDPDVSQWDLSVHQHMYAVANVKARTMLTDLISTYGDSVRDAFNENTTNGTSYADTASDTIFFDLNDADDDMYMSGKTSFHFTAVPNDTRPKAPKPRTTLVDDTDDSIAFSETDKQNSTPPHASDTTGRTSGGSNVDGGR